MKLIKHLEDNKISKLAFAREMNVKPNQVYRWMRRDALYVDGDVYVKITKHKAKR